MLGKQQACGAPSEGEITDDIHEYVNVALSSHNSQSNEEKKVIVKVVKVIKQVVAGMKYTIDFIAEGENSKQQHNCQVVLLSQPWINPQPEVLKFTSTPAN